MLSNHSRAGFASSSQIHIQIGDLSNNIHIDNGRCESGEEKGKTLGVVSMI